MTEKQEKIINQSVKMLTISEDEAGQRIDNYLLAKLKGVPKSLIRPLFTRTSPLRRIR